MAQPPAFIAHNLTQMYAVADACRQTGSHAVLYSASGAADSLGPDVFAAMIGETRARYPDAPVEFVLDCGESAGAALSALRREITDIALHLPPSPRQKIESIAAKYQATVRHGPQNALDLSDIARPLEAALKHLEGTA